MTARPRFAVLLPLIGDTFRQANASGITAMMLTVTAVCTLLCLSVTISGDVPLHDKDETVYFLPTAPESVAYPGYATADRQRSRSEGIETVRGRATLAFGLVSFPMSRERRDSVHFLETILAGGIAGTFGLLLALVWTAGFLPNFLDPGSASVLIAKPVSRQGLLINKYFSVLAFVGLQVTLFVGLTWLGLGVRTRVWDAAYLWCIPLLLLQFAVFYGFSVLLAVATRSTVACVFGSVLFWLLSWGINYGSVMAHGLGDSKAVPSPALVLTDAAYWISPKPIDAALVLFNTLDAGKDFEKPVAFRFLESRKAYSPTASVVSTLLLAAVLLAISTYEFKATDY